MCSDDYCFKCYALTIQCASTLKNPPTQCVKDRWILDYVWCWRVTLVVTLLSHFRQWMTPLFVRVMCSFVSNFLLIKQTGMLRKYLIITFLTYSPLILAYSPWRLSVCFSGGYLPATVFRHTVYLCHHHWWCHVWTLWKVVCYAE